MMYPLVLDLAEDGIPVTVTCRVLGFSTQAFYKWRKAPLSQRDWDDAHLINAARDIHADDPAFGYRFIADELPGRGITAGENRVARLCSQERIWSIFAKKRGLNRRSGPPVHDDLVDRQFSAQTANQVWLTDINDSMLRVGRDRLTDDGLLLPVAVCDAEKLPFPNGYFDRVSVAFGLRNMTHKDRALAEMARVLKPGGKLFVLEFSKVAKPLAPAYDWYSFKVLPWLGRKVANDEGSYRYLAESIRMHPDQATLAGMLEAAGLGRVQYFNLSAGVVALHEGVKLD